MTIYSNEIKNFLDKIYFYELSHREDISFPLYNYYEGKLCNIEKLHSHIPSSTFPMSRDRLFSLIVGRLEFGYSFDGVNVCVEYYVNIDPQNDWFDKLITENNNTKTRNNMKQKIKLTEGDLHRIIKKVVRGALNEGMTSDNSYYEKWENIKDILGSDKMVDDIFNYLDSSMLEKIVDWFDQDYDLFDNDEEDDW